MYLALASSLRPRRLILCVQSVLISWMHDGLSMSRDDLKFMNDVADSVVQCADGHYQVSLP